MVTDREVESSSYVTEDLGSVPDLMKTLDIEDLMSDPDCKMSLQTRCEMCFKTGTWKDCAYRKYADLGARRKSLERLGMTKERCLDMAQTGLFSKDGRNVTCYHCGQVLQLETGADPMFTHADLYRNCKQTCRNLGYPDRCPKNGKEMASCPTSIKLETRQRRESC